MNPEDLDLPQPPEGVLYPKIPWSRINPNSRLWLVLKSKLTGRRQGDESYTSFVNLSDADADRLIANLKKDPRGYPSLDQESGTPLEWMERQEKYQRWLVEAYLENPFREQTNKKIEEAEIERRVKEIQEQKRKAKEEQEEKEKRKQEIADTLNNKPQPEVQPQDKLLPADPLDIPDPWEGSETVPNIVTPVTTKPTLLLPPAKDPEPAAESEVDQPKQEKKQKKEKSFVIPQTLSPEIQKTITNFSGNLDSIRRQMSRQTSILSRTDRKYRKIVSDLESTKFLLSQQVENYREALDDLETQQRITEAYTAPIGPQPMESPTPWAVTGPEDVGNEQGFTPRLPSKPVEKLAEGGINTSPNFAEKMLQPGIYDNPTIGTLPPNSAVVPLNRNSGKELMGQYDTQQYVQALGETMFKPINALLGGALVNLGDILKDLGPFAGYFNAGIKSLLGSLSGLLKLPVTTILDLLGGPAYAGTQPNDEEMKNFYASWKSYLDKNNLVFPGDGGAGGGGDGGLEGEVFKDILTIGEKGEGLRMFGGTNVGKMPAWIPFPKSEFNKLEYSSGFGLRWGKNHNGLDLAGEPGIKIISPFAGKVSRMDNDTEGGGYGKYVEIEHTNPKIFTFYGHMRAIANGMTVGSPVQAGQLIGELGTTGRSTGPHLHWEVRERSGGGQIDPVPFTHKFKPGGGQPPEKKLEDYPEYELDAYTQYDEGKIVRLGRKLYKINKLGALGDEVSLESGGTVGSFKWGGTLHTNVSVESKKLITKSRPLPKVQRTLTTPVATSTKTQPKVYNIQAPQTGPSIQMMPTATLKPEFIMIDIPTNSILKSNEIRRML